MKTKRFFSTLMISFILLSSLSACSSNNIKIQDIPVHPNASETNTESFVTNLPWSLEESGQILKVFDGPYKGYKVDGPNYYMFWKRDIEKSPLDEFYNSKLTEMGWTQGESSIYISGLGNMVVGQSWVKDNQVIFLTGYNHPMQSTVYILAVYLMTK